MKNINFRSIFIIAIILFSILTIIESQGNQNYANQDNWKGECNLKTSEQQSPILIDGNKVQEKNEIKVVNTNYAPFRNVQKIMKSEPQNEGIYSFSYVYDKIVDDFIVIEKDNKELKYNFYEINLHCPTEHKIKNFNYDCELQVVNIRHNYLNNQHEQDKLIVSIFIKGDGVAENSMFTDRDMNISPYINLKQDFYYYEGSLTVPPCTEKVGWLINTKPVTIAKIQLDNLNEWITQTYPYNGNNRDIIPQDTNIDDDDERKIYLIKAIKGNYLLINSIILIFSLLLLLL
jgi:carbonic anhydrase